ncbi:rieske 2Fe-2S domain protein [Asticcacaulis biprosthecium C19]|uniref:Rieske 2Fe-2S domain protein n=1 Tax=Asticcacaulis biprosthecium C19 TaxID=715226 RepID=F4QT69_9CAUL|nr:Rieske 2Fe-2S domain-containing protein [Asticcacaulis biprosthecium]EGF89939.1 rieske 2Fe-2S domain protein [Asticcacaulis biprosthecium C19]
MDDIKAWHTRIELRSGWYAVALSSDLKDKPLRVMFDGQAYVLWRDGGRIGSKIGALADICPHRGAPLSLGRIQDGGVVCPYHGWRFERDGRCSHMPALASPAPAFIAPVQAAEGDGFVFLGRHAADLPLPIAPLVPGGTSVIMTGQVATTLGDFAENILDTTHTSVVHGGYLRGTDGRQPVTPTVVTGLDWIEAHYPPAATPDGFMGRFMGQGGYHITDRFRAPNITEVEYRQNGRLVFGTRFHLTPTEAGQIRAFGTMALAGQSWLTRAKISMLQVLFQRIIAEDRMILNAVSANRAAFGRTPHYIAPQDVLRAGIDALLRGDSPAVPARMPDMLV